jgi:hypothetical protein
MARIIPDNNPIGNLGNFVPNATQVDISSIAKKALRLKIIADRYTRGFEVADVNGPRDAFETSGLPIFETEKLNREKKFREGRTGRQQDPGRSAEDYESEEYSGTSYNPDYNGNNYNRIVTDTITIVDIDHEPKHNDTRGYSSITLPFVPRELSYQASSKFIGIATMGRNTPYYQFTGSEDSLQFDIDWFANDNDRKDVINSCRWLEALSKSDGYEETPHRVKLVWGQDDLLFQDDIWIVTEANYSLTDFVKAYKDSNNNVVRVGMLPQQALQKITLKRLSDNNRRSSEVIGRLAKNNNYGN